MRELIKRIRLSKDEWNIIFEKMEKANLNFSEFARMSMINSQIFSKKEKRAIANKELIIELAKIGNNLNQVAKHLNIEKKGIDRVSLEMLSRIDNHLKELRAEYGC
ncbi:TPA: plasmid mobilization relaxosome protein MobC [Campylobacter fetus subsp. venerealis]|nr:plasmid mobilization relaxosome protein MobC [Campylobacter fetus subsp. venerealis]